MLPFLQFPREVRDIIYDYCLIHDGEIIPYPTHDEREEIEQSGGKPAKRCIRRNNALEDTSTTTLQSCGGITYANDWPCIALLAVNKKIQEEAAIVLFGMNVWCLSNISYGPGTADTGFWGSYALYFRHITTHMSMNDVEDILPFARRWRDSDEYKPTQKDDFIFRMHTKRLYELRDGFEWKSELLIQMPLKSLVFDLENLFCPYGCCREDAILLFCHAMSEKGPWYRKIADMRAGRTLEDTLRIEKRSKVDNKVLGMNDCTSGWIFGFEWGLEGQWDTDSEQSEESWPGGPFGNGKRCFHAGEVEVFYCLRGCFVVVLHAVADYV